MKRNVLLGSVVVAMVALFSAAAVLRSANSQASWEDLDSVAELRDQFNEDEGSARIVLLLSPT